MRKLGLVTLEYRRDRADMIQIYKSIHNFDQLKWDRLFSLAQDDLRGHYLKFKTKKCLHNVRLNSFSQRCVKYWNNLKEETVSAKSVNEFKSKLNVEKWNNKKFNPTCY